jgi:hypothetical protein
MSVVVSGHYLHVVSGFRFSRTYDLHACYGAPRCCPRTVKVRCQAVSQFNPFARMYTSSAIRRP